MSYTDTQLSNLSPSPRYNTIRSRDEILPLTLANSKAFTSSRIPTLLAGWKLVTIPDEPDGSQTVFVLEAEFLKSRTPRPQRQVVKLGSAFDTTGDEESRQAVLNQLTDSTFAAFSHMAKQHLSPRLGSELRSHDPDTTLGATLAEQCQLTRDDFHKILQLKMDAVVDRKDPPTSVLLTPDQWNMTNKAGEDLRRDIEKVSRTRRVTTAKSEFAMKGEKLKKVEELGIYWRNADGSLSWVAGDNSLVPKLARHVSQPESGPSHPSSRDYRGEWSDPAGLSKIKASPRSDWVGAECPEATAGFGELTEEQEHERERDELWKEFYQG